MNARRCLKIADRIDTLLRAELGVGLDLQRMLDEPLYRRDVLLVCDAHAGHELAELARLYRAAEAESPPEAGPRSGVPGNSGFVSSLFDLFRASDGASLPPAPPDAAKAQAARRTQGNWYSPSRWRR